ncbi:ABC transporter ATP-binding protein [Reyranella sp. MMS21-HV4-11]|uniref:ABC transporter ATP-binding protein n=1 Tax=Reyranella humidisoli TaxID=2849149 RepID=A0ABS6IDC8_9HYPH|nr:ABC transporter ATP-binding protein [Reyranella sp. MMS21-HV4-11]MBU8872606.1 ABC transporter ATP-binding protein [Reyranella sp. MMS21-HV4-11]
MTTPLLKVDSLRIALAGDDVTYNAVENVSFEIGRGEAFGLVGESGCGKSITALSVMGLLRRPLSLAGGRIVLDGQEIQNVSAAEMRRLRGKRIAMIFQEPMTALNPLSPVGKQIAEMFVLHQGANWSEAMDRAEEALRQVRVPSPERRIKDYPHQLSGGMRQRVMIAIALACGPDLLVADEPTTALDVTVQAEIIDLMAELCAAKGTAILMISHDLGLVANMCKRVAVMYAGRIVESQVADSIFARPSHPYTQGLIDSLPRLGERARRGRQKLREISGVVPSIANYPAGCRFNPRCSAVTDVCRTVVPEATPLPAEGVVRCHHHG